MTTTFSFCVAYVFQREVGGGSQSDDTFFRHENPFHLCCVPFMQRSGRLTVLLSDFFFYIGLASAEKNMSDFIGIIRLRSCLNESEVPKEIGDIDSGRLSEVF